MMAEAGVALPVPVLPVLPAHTVQHAVERQQDEACADGGSDGNGPARPGGRPAAQPPTPLPRPDRMEDNVEEKDSGKKETKEEKKKDDSPEEERGRSLSREERLRPVLVPSPSRMRLETPLLAAHSWKRRAVPLLDGLLMALLLAVLALALNKWL